MLEILVVLALIPFAFVGLVMLLRLIQVVLKGAVIVTAAIAATGVAVAVLLGLSNLVSEVSVGTRDASDLIVPVCGVAFVFWCFGGFRYLAKRFVGESEDPAADNQTVLGKPMGDWDKHR